MFDCHYKGLIVSHAVFCRGISSRGDAMRKLLEKWGLKNSADVEWIAL